MQKYRETIHFQYFANVEFFKTEPAQGENENEIASWKAYNVANKNESAKLQAEILQELFWRCEWIQDKGKQALPFKK